MSTQQEWQPYSQAGVPEMELKPREVQQFLLGHTAGQQQKWDLNPLSSVPDTELTPLVPETDEGKES